MDRVTLFDPDPVPPPGPRPTARTFILLLDSLRYDVAMDPSIMPTLASMREEGEWAQVESAAYAVTVATLRVFFTGRENFSLLAFVSDFTQQFSEKESLLHQLASLGVPMAAYTGRLPPFKHLMKRVHPSPEETPDSDDATALLALEAFLQEDFGLVFAHLDYTDMVAHSHGVRSPRYRELYQRADRLVAQIRARLPADVNFIVTGDHGHDLRGCHILGIRVPTFCVYTGPAYRRGVALGTLHAADQRRMFSRPYGLSAPSDSAPSVKDLLVPPPLRTWPGRVGSWLYFAFLVTLFLNMLARSPLRLSGILAWPPVLAVFLPLPWSAAAGIGMGIVALALASVGLPLRRSLPWTVGLVALGAAFHGLGVAWSPLDAWVHAGSAGPVWVGLAVALVWGGRRLYAGAALLLPPANAPLGWTGMLVPALLGLSRKSPLVLLFTLPFAVPIDEEYLFEGWRSLLTGKAVTSAWILVGLGFLARCVALIQPRSRPRVVLAGVVCAALLTAMPSGRLTPPWALGLLAFTAFAWGVRRRVPDLGSVLMAASAWSWYQYFVVIAPPNLTQVACFIAALSLLARAGGSRAPAAPSRAGGDGLVLYLLGLVVVGFGIMNWSVAPLEWTRLYDWFTAAQVEHFAIWMLPWILGKGLVLLYVLRHALRVQVDPYQVRLCVGIKAAFLLMMMTGFGYSGSLLGYIEAAQQTVVAGLLFVYVLVVE